MRKALRRPVLVFALAALSLSLFACAESSSDGAASTAAVVSVAPSFAEVAPLGVVPFSAVVTGTAITSVTWELPDPTGGQIDSSGLFTASDVPGFYRVVARSTGSPAASATADVTVTATPEPPPTGRALGVNLSWWNYWDSQVFADTARQGNWQSTDAGHLANSDADGWPTTNFKVGFGTFETGTFKLRFTGQATLSAQGGSLQNQTYDAGTNTTTADFVVSSVSGSSPWGAIILTNTRRRPGDTTGSGVTDGTGVTALTVMRPGRSPDVGSAATRFEAAYVGALQRFQWVRPMQTFGMGSGVNSNTDAYWSDADAIAAGVPAYAPTTHRRFGEAVISNGKVYIATFGPSGNWGSTTTYAAGATVYYRVKRWRSLVAGNTNHPPDESPTWWEPASVNDSTSPNHHTKSEYNTEGPLADGDVLWGRAARVKPNGRAGSQSGPAWEDLILLANRSRVAPWLTIPYFATDLYVTKLAKLIKYGSKADGEPCEATACAGRVYPPLDSSLPFIVEWSNEIWNSALYPSNYHNAIALDLFEKQGNPWGFSATSQVGREYSAALAARMSLLFRAVFGDAEMMTRVRPVWAGQIGWGSGFSSRACGVALKYLDSVWNAPARATVNGYQGNHPPSYYLYGIAGATYIDWTGTTVDELFASWNSILAVTAMQRLVDWDQWAFNYGIKTLQYEGTNQLSSALITQAQQSPRYTTAIQDVVRAFWNTPNGTADVYAHFRMDEASNNSGLGYPASAHGGDKVAAYKQAIVTRDTPAWAAMRALRAETGR